MHTILKLNVASQYMNSKAVAVKIFSVSKDLRAIQDDHLDLNLICYQQLNREKNLSEEKDFWRPRHTLSKLWWHSKRLHVRLIKK